MAGSTQYFGLGFFDFGDALGTDFAGQVEIDRFVFIDKQLYGLMSIFGNGVISGWTVAAEESFTISISEGFGNINFIAGRTTFPFTIEDIQPNSINYVFAKVKNRTTFAEDVDFIISTSRNLNDPNFLLLAEVTTGPSSITNVDNSIRQEIGFLELIKAAIRLHKHRGGSLNPSKIDLSSEVKGQLPSFRIADFDAEKITTGTFDLTRMPVLNHSDLTNVGLLTHPQLDTFVKTLEVSNKEIFGEIGTANLLQLILAMKLIHDDPDSAFYISDRTFDENMINEIAVIPGITPNTYIDFDNTTAEVNLEQHYIKGVPPATGTSFFVTYNTGLAWRQSYSLDNVIVVGDTVTLAFNDDDESNIVTIEGFESATSPGQSLAGGSGGQTLFTKETLIISDNADITASSSSTNVIEGFYSGEFTHRQSFRNRYTKEFTEGQDWSTYDSFVVNVKCLDSIHGSVKMYLEDSNGEQSTEFIILDQDEITENSDPQQNNFEMRVIDLATVLFRNDVKKIVFFTDDLENPFSFFVDFINIQRAVLLPESGKIILRYSSAVRLIFSTLSWTSIEPTGTDIKVRARSADGTAFLTRADWTPFLISGDVVNLEGTDIEVEITLLPDDDRITSPVLQSFRILLLTEAEVDGFAIDSSTEFARGTSENVTLNSSPTSIELQSPVYVDSYYFCLGNTMNQIHEETTDSGSTFAQGELAIFGTNTPVSPNQVFKTIEDGKNRVSLSRLFGPRSVRRKDKRTFVIADTYNDRVLEFDEEQNLLAGIGSINYEHGSKTFPISACVDTRTGILYIVWSRRISFKTVNVSKITLQTSTEKIQLIRDFDKINGLTTSELESVNSEGQIMAVHLSSQNAGLAETYPSNSTFLFVSGDALTSGTSTDSVFYSAVATALGIPVFIGKFAYIDGIFSPTWADKTDDDGFIISNGTVAIKEYEFESSLDETISRTTTVSNIIETDKNNNLIFGSNIMEFSPFIPGRAEKIDDNTLLIGGLRPGGIEGTPTTDAPFNFRVVSGSDDNKTTQKQVLENLFFGGSTPYVGAVVVFDRRSNATTFEYVSAEGVLVSDVDIDPNTGEYVVAESSFQKSGRIIKLDTAGNISFSYGEGLYSLINDIFVQVDSSIVIST